MAMSRNNKLIIAFALLSILLILFIPRDKHKANVEIPPATTVERKINLNTATVIELANLPGLGQKTALAIIEYREQQGGFKTVDEIRNIKGIGEIKEKAWSDLFYIE